MLTVIPLIEDRRDAYEQHPFIRFLKDESYTADQRLAYAPFAAHFVLTFAEVNRFFLREDDPVDEHQQAVNVHADEDGRHFAWYLRDLHTLGYDTESSFAKMLAFVWSDLGFHTRDLGYFAVASAAEAGPKLRIAIIEALEAMGNVWLAATVDVARLHTKRDDLIYFAEHHLDRETGHAIGSEESTIRAIELSPQERAKAVPIINGLFDRMEAFNAEILQRVQKAFAQSSDGDSLPAIPDFMMY